MAAPLACAGGTAQCSFGGPSEENVLPVKRVNINNMPAATMMDNTPANIPSCGMCSAPSNPEFIAATAAKLGMPTPVLCVPNIVTPWTCNPTVTIGGEPTVPLGATCNCLWGLVTMVNSGQPTVVA